MTITIEWETRKDLFGKLKETPVDVHTESPYAVLLFECKFTETNGGTCSQTNKDKGGFVPCNGHYERQTNPPRGKPVGAP